MQFPAIPASVLVDAAARFLIGSAGTASGQECSPEITDPAQPAPLAHAAIGRPSGPGVADGLYVLWRLCKLQQ